MKHRGKLKFGIFQKLLISYVLFALLMVVTFAVIIIVSVQNIAGFDMAVSGPFDVVDEKGNLQNLEMVEGLHGWIEELDMDYHVKEIYGEKLTEQMDYTQDQLFTLLSASGRNGMCYIGNIITSEKDGEPVFYLTIYERDVVKTEPTILLSDSNALSGQAKMFLLLFLTAFILECFCLSYYLSRKIRKPLKKMVRGMEEIRQGNQTVRMDFKTEAEFEEIRDTFNMMMETIETQQEKNKELEAKKRKLLLELSHDIRTPLATIKSCASALEAGVVEELKKKEFYQRIDQKADRVCQLSEDMFMMLRMENPEYQMELKAQDICELCRQICAEHYDDVVDAGLNFETNIPEKHIVLSVDEHLLRRAIGELILNGIKYNQCGKLLQIDVYQNITCRKLCIYVVDDGEKIEKNIQNILFDAFARGDKARKTDGGTGLGLSIVKTIVEKHGGNIFYRREEKKNCFQIELPLQ